MPYSNAVPPLPAIDMRTCNRCGKCAEAFPDHIDLDRSPSTMDVEAGVILLNTGFEPYEPNEGEFAYKTDDRVVTLQTLKRLIELSDNTLMHADRNIKNIAFIYCVGSRQKGGENQYCARYCCTSAIHTSLLLRKRFSDIKCFHLYRDIRTYGKQELLYETSCKEGDIYLKFSEESPPRVEAADGRLRVTVEDILTDGEEIAMEPDLVVLVTAMTARRGDALTEILKVPVGRDQFFNEIHPKLRPVETVIDGIFISGACQGPKNIAETVASSLSAAAKANSKVSKGRIELDPMVAAVNSETCEWCGRCAEVCTYDAVRKVDVKGRQVAEIIQATCKGCGACVPVCPLDAVDLVGYTNDEVEAMIDALAEEVV
jgi:heterodisulfide reductase subunit A